MAPGLSKLAALVLAFAVVAPARPTVAETLTPEETRERGEQAYAAGNHVVAAQWFRTAADKGSTAAQVILGWLYRQGRGVPQDDQEALRWFRLAALLGNAGAEYSLGVVYDQGAGVAPDPAAAAAWYLKAANKGNAQAQNNLGWLYQNGRGVPQDLAQAAAWYRRAAGQGQPDAAGNLGLLYLDGRGVPRDRARALRLLQQAAAEGDQEAQRLVERLSEEDRQAAATERARAEQRAEQQQLRQRAAAAQTAAAQTAAVMSTANHKLLAPPATEAAPPSSPQPLAALEGAWQSHTPIVDLGVRQMYLRLEIERTAVTFHYDCRYIDGSHLTGSFTSRVKLHDETIDVIDGGKSRVVEGENVCAAGIRPVALPYRLSGATLTITFGGRPVVLIRRGDDG